MARLGPVLVSLPDPAATRRLGEAIGQVAQPGDLLLLDGVFGAGKTTFVQGLARGLGVSDGVSSPSFVLEHQHAGRLPLYHVDLYRLEQLDPAFADELAEHLLGDGVAAVEWPALLPASLRAGATTLRFTIESDGVRQVVVNTGHDRLRAAVLSVRPAC